MSQQANGQMKTGITRSLLAAVSVFALQGVAQAASAQDASAVQPISLNGGNLSEVIVELSRESGVPIFVSGELIEGINVPPLSGEMSVRTALESLTFGQELEISENESGALIIKSVNAPKEISQSEASISTSLSGQVTAAGTMGYLEGALVEIPSLNRSAETDREGRFVIRNLPAGTFDVLITYQGKRDFSSTVKVADGKSKTLSVAMLPLSADDDVGVMDKVIVTASPIADSEAAAYSRQKASDNLVNIIASDTIGRFPDQNVAAALSRVPGVSVERDQGQARYINLRGAPTKWTTLSFNGLNIVSPSGRTPRFDTVPNAIVSSIETTKATTADMPAESIAGNVNIITRSPFDHNGLMISGQVAGGYMELGGGGEQDLNLAISNTFNNDTMGFVVSAAHYERDQVTDNIENRFEQASEARGTPGEDIIWASQYDYRLYRLNRQNSAYSGRFDWRPNADHELFVSSIYTEFRDHEQRHLLRFDLDDSEACYAQVSCGNTFEEGIVYGVEGDGQFNTGLSIQSILTNTLGGDHFIKGWDVSWRLNQTSANDEGFAYSQYAFTSDSSLESRFTVEYDYTDPDYPIFTMFDTIDNGDGTYSAGQQLDFYDVERLKFDRVTEYHNLDMTQSWGGRIDLERDISVYDLPVTVKFGGSYDTRLKKVKEDRTQVSPDTLEAAGLSQFNATEIMSDELMFGEFPSGWDGYLYDHDKAARVLRTALAQGAGEYQSDRFLENYYRVQEDIAALYAMATVDFDWGNIVAGLRVERSENEGEAYGVEDDEFVLLDAGDSHTGYFPSIHINYDITEDQKFRLSFNSGLARADFDTRAPNFEINDEDQEISGGNPFVKPELAYGVDAYYEWYLKPVGILSAGAFFKYIKDPIVSMNTRFGSNQLNTPLYNRADYMFDTDANGDKGQYYGLEFVYAQKFDFLPDYGLPEWTDGFGFNGNLTIADSEITLGDGRTAPMTSSSDYNYNTSVYWEKYGISARVNWQWRTEWLNSYGSSDDFDRYWDGLGRLSFGARYQANDNLEFYFDAKNLTDQVGRRYRGNDSRVYEIEGFGRTYMAGLRFNF